MDTFSGCDATSDMSTMHINCDEMDDLSTLFLPYVVKCI